jgi:hypothetical protein
MSKECDSKWAHYVDDEIRGDVDHSSFMLKLKNASPEKSAALRELSFEVSQRLQAIALSDIEMIPPRVTIFKKNPISQH